MDCFTMQIAGLNVQVQPMFASTKEYCRAYLIDQPPALYVTVNSEDLVYEQAMLDREAVEEGLRFRKFTDPFMERMTIQRKIADHLILQDILLLHGSTVCVDGVAYLFTAPCGTGKSTHTRLWRQIFGDRAVMVNDDKTFLRITDSGVFAYGSPWSGKHGLDSNICVPLKGICILRRGPENLIQRLTAADGLAFLKHQSHTPDNSKGPELVNALTHKLVDRVPLWKLECNKEPQAAVVSYQAMSGQS